MHSFLKKNECMFNRDKPTKTHTSLSELGNMPASMNEGEQRVLSQLIATAQVSAGRWFLVACLEAIAIVVLGFALNSYFPLVRPLPYMVKVDDVSGQVLAKPVAAADFKVEPRFVAAEANMFVRGLMTIDPYTTRSELSKVSSRVASKASAELKEYLNTERPFERLAKTPGLIRTTQISSVDASQRGIVFVFAQTSERISSGEPIVTKWRFTIHYAIEPAMDEKTLLENPLGFVVTHFEKVQDSLR